MQHGTLRTQWALKCTSTFRRTWTPWVLSLHGQKLKYWDKLVAEYGQYQTAIHCAARPKNQQREFMTPSLATCAQFFRIGLEAGLCEPDLVRAWALSVIDKMDEPPGEIIEVSWNKPIPQLISDLNSVQGDANFEIAGRWLLYILLHELPSEARLWQTITAAKQVAMSAGRSTASTSYGAFLSLLKMN